ncbi:MAG: restriction endonuclease subunit S [Alphaproteobacteria bacterium]|nr:restriction endonuclease subunit S [Alphaproteobacteria bacterium]MBR1600716.1 restriction endonuclease subunit S [Alphaproteobacteria bacterium]
MVKLGEVAKERRENIKIDKANMPIVGLEHLIPQQVQLTEWSNDADNTFTKLFHKGDVLFGRRRAYLKKASLAPFDGICSGDITVIAPIEDKIAPELLPFIIQNDAFFDYAVEKSAGSLSPRVKWEHLKNYEFELPGLEEQRKLAKILWAAEETKQAYKTLLQKTDEIIKVRFIEMFGFLYGKDEPKWEKYNFNQIISDASKFGKKIPKDDYLEEGTYAIVDQSQNYIAGYTNTSDGIYTDIPAIIFGDHTRCFKYINFPFFLGADGVKLLKTKKKNVNYIFLIEELKQIPVPNMGYNRHFRFLSEFPIYLPSFDLQSEFADFVQQVDQSKQQLLTSLDSLNATMRALSNENLK